MNYVAPWWLPGGHAQTICYRRERWDTPDGDFIDLDWLDTAPSTTLLVNARNDPFVPAHSLPPAHQVGGQVTLWQPAAGGHMGFALGRPRGHLQALPQQMGGWLAGSGASHG